MCAAAAAVAVVQGLKVLILCSNSIKRGFACIKPMRKHVTTQLQ